jgi:alpha-beta hydrolase superfamily lysophospholipase
MLPVAMFTVLTACAKPYVHPAGEASVKPRLETAYAVMEDGFRLPVSIWKPPGDTHAVVLALHGFNDYRHAFENPGQYLAQRGITVIAWDQRGFGQTAGNGLWHGSDRLRDDLLTMSRLVQEHYPELPLYLLGESMGGAVVLTALASPAPPETAGTILVAPAVWTRDAMPFYQRWALSLASSTFPSWRLTAEGLDIQPSDNTGMLQALKQDDLVIKETRVDVLYGLSNLMDEAMRASQDATGNILLMYGAKDEIIPAEPSCELFTQLEQNPSVRLNAIVYAQGYHMLTRDLQADIVMGDIAARISGQPLEYTNATGMNNFCAALDSN